MTAANSISSTALGLINAAAQEIGVLASGEQLQPSDQAWGLQKLQRLIDRWNARRPMVYTTTFTPFSLVANLAPHTIGPTGTFPVNQRPVDIPSIGLQLVSQNEPVEIPLNKRDRDWWAGQSIKGLTSTLPTDYYYEPDWPNGSIYFWPVPTAVNNVLVQQQLVIGQYTGYGQTFSMPPAYWDAIVYELALTLAPSFQTQPSQLLTEMWKASIKAIEGNNISSPRLASDAPSQDGANACRPGFSFLNGLSR